jgi:hypothetical protein
VVVDVVVAELDRVHERIAGRFTRSEPRAWALADLPGIEDMIEFETRVNYVVGKYDDLVICAYDLSKFGARTVVYALRTHPVVIVGGLLQENPFYVDPSQLLLELREQRSHAGNGMAG